MREYVLLYINGERVEVRGADAFLMLSDFLRYRRRLTGTKIVCAEGDCGACTVVRAFPAPHRKKEAPTFDFQAMNACIAPVATLDCSHLITIEGLREDGELCELQRAMVASHGAQCGFCTPGIVMALSHLFEKHKKKITTKDVQNHLTGNLCRCTGYAPIIDAAMEVDRGKVRRLRDRYGSKGITRELEAHLKSPVRIEADGKVFFSPTEAKAAASFKGKSRGEARVFSAATDLGVPMNKGTLSPRVFLGLNQIAEFYKLKKMRGEVFVGSKITLTELERFAEREVPELAAFLRVFASPQIKNVATLAGNVANGSPIGDTLPFLLVSQAVIEVIGMRGRREIAFEKFYAGYRKTTLKADEIIVGIRFKLPSKTEKLRLFKICQRKDLDISCVNAGFRFTLKNEKVIQARLAFGGVGPTVLALSKTARFLEGKALTPDTVARSVELIAKEISPRSDLRGSADYRVRMSQNLFKKFIFELSQGGVK